MSQLTKTVFGSWGLIVGWNIAPPPPGPIILKLPGRSSVGVAKASAANAIRRRSNTIGFFPLLSLTSFRFLFGRMYLLCQSLCARGIKAGCEWASQALAPIFEHFLCLDQK